MSDRTLPFSSTVAGYLDRYGSDIVVLTAGLLTFVFDFAQSMLV
jgi:hypothetical protein